MGQANIEDQYISRLASDVNDGAILHCRCAMRAEPHSQPIFLFVVLKIDCDFVNLAIVRLEIIAFEIAAYAFAAVLVPAGKHIHVYVAVPRENDVARAENGFERGQNFGMCIEEFESMDFRYGIWLGPAKAEAATGSNKVVPHDTSHAINFDGVEYPPQNNDPVFRQGDPKCLRIDVFQSIEASNRMAVSAHLSGFSDRLSQLYRICELPCDIEVRCIFNAPLLPLTPI